MFVEENYYDPEVVIQLDSLGECGSGPFACIMRWRDIGNQSPPATVNLAAKNWTMSGITGSDLCGRIAHEMGHSTGLSTAAFCGGGTSIMQGSSANGNRAVNSVQSGDVDESIRFNASPNPYGDCQGIQFSDPIVEEGGESGGGGDPDPWCGDNSCNGNEDCSSCDLDCGSCGSSCNAGDCDCAFPTPGCEQWCDDTYGPCDGGGCEPLTSWYCDDLCYVDGYFDLDCNGQNDYWDCDAYYGPCMNLMAVKAQPDQPASIVMNAQLASAVGLAVCAVPFRRRRLRHAQGRQSPTEQG
jgi:hypothetical protein